MPRYRVAAAAAADLHAILETSFRLHGPLARQRYRSLVTTAFRRIAKEPEAASAQRLDHLRPGLRSLHLRIVAQGGDFGIRRPVHSIFYRVAEDGLVDMLRLLHERQDVSGQLGFPSESA